MIHNTTVEQQTFDLLKGKQRYLVIKHNPLFMPGDTLTVSLEDSREQLSFEIVTVDALNTRNSIVGLYKIPAGALPGYPKGAAPSPETEVRFH